MKKFERSAFRILNKLHLSSISNRITLYFSLLVAIIIFIIISATVGIFSSRFLEQNNKIVYQKLGFVTQEIGNKINTFRNVAFSLKNDSYLQGAFANDSENTLILKSKIDHYVKNTYGMQSIIVLDKNINIIGENNPYDTKAFFNMPDVQAFLSSMKEEKITAPHNFPVSAETGNYMGASKVTYIHTVRDSVNYDKKGYLLINIDKNNLFSGKQELCRELFDVTYIISKEGKIITRFGPEEIQIEQTAKMYATQNYVTPGYNTIFNNTYFKQHIPQYPDWVVVGVASNGSLKSDLKFIISIIMLIGVVSIITVVIISHRISAKITQPIHSMKEAMKVFENGEMPEKIVSESKDELSYLISGFNSMIDDIVRLVDAIYHEQDEKKKAEVAAVQFQLESLQSQINPHFLYNTLNTVTYLAVKANNSEIRDLIQSLNVLLRSTLSNQNRFVTIEEEIYFLQSYANIQAHRYPNMAEIEYNVDEDVLGYQIPKLILQPIVENALLHGIFPKEGVGHINVTIASRGEMIDVFVIDDGVGINSRTFDYIKNKNGGFNSIGLSNVDERLILYFDESSRLNITSKENEGTTVSFTIPKKRDLC